MLFTMRGNVSLGYWSPSTVPQIIVEVAKLMDIGLKGLATLPQVIAEVVDVGQI